MEALYAQLEELKARLKGLVGSAYIIAPRGSGERRRPKYPLPEPFDRDLRKL